MLWDSVCVPTGAAATVNSGVGTTLCMAGDVTNGSLLLIRRWLARASRDLVGGEGGGWPLCSRIPSLPPSPSPERTASHPATHLDYYLGS
jgi:hypothetical protein